MKGNPSRLPLPIDKGILCILLYGQMNEIQIKLAELKSKGWTYASIADEVGVTSDAVEKWKSGTRKTHSEKAVLIRLEQLTEKKPPKQRRYADGSHNKGNN